MRRRRAKGKAKELRDAYAKALWLEGSTQQEIAKTVRTTDMTVHSIIRKFIFNEFDLKKIQKHFQDARGKYGKIRKWNTRRERKLNRLAERLIGRITLIENQMRS